MTVTNQSDKEMQLPKILKLDKTVKDNQTRMQQVRAVAMAAIALKRSRNPHTDLPVVPSHRSSMGRDAAPDSQTPRLLARHGARSNADNGGAGSGTRWRWAVRRVQQRAITHMHAAPCSSGGGASTPGSGEEDAGRQTADERDSVVSLRYSNV